MEMLICKSSITLFGFDMVEDKMYYYWSNFEGLNHFICASGEEGQIQKCSKDNERGEWHGPASFSGSKKKGMDKRPYLYDFFWTKEEMRNIQISNLLS